MEMIMEICLSNAKILKVCSDKLLIFLVLEDPWY